MGWRWWLRMAAGLAWYDLWWDFGWCLPGPGASTADDGQWWGQLELTVACLAIRGWPWLCGVLGLGLPGSWVHDLCLRTWVGRWLVGAAYVPGALVRDCWALAVGMEAAGGDSGVLGFAWFLGLEFWALVRPSWTPMGRSSWMVGWDLSDVFGRSLWALVLGFLDVLRWIVDFDGADFLVGLGISRTSLGSCPRSIAESGGVLPCWSRDPRRSDPQAPRQSPGACGAPSLTVAGMMME